MIQVFLLEFVCFSCSYLIIHLLIRKISKLIAKKVMFSQLLEKYSKDIKSKTSRCKHEEGCLPCALRQALKGFALGYSFKTALNLLGVLT